MFKPNVAVRYFGTVAAAVSVAGCAGINQQIAETRQRGTIESGGYTWQIPADSEGGNTVQAQGLPSRQVATTVSSTLCKRHGRVAQFVSQRGVFITGTQIFDFNCVR